MTTAASSSTTNLPVPARAFTIAGARVGVLEGLLLATLFTCTFTKLFWEPAGKFTLAHVLGAVYVAAYVIDRAGTRDVRVARPVAMLAAFFGATILVWCAGYLTIDSIEGRAQFWKAFLTYGLHFSIALVAAAHIARRGLVLVRAAVLVFIAGFCVNAAYGVAQLLVWGAGHRDLDALLLKPLPFSDAGAKGILDYGGGIYRVNGLTRDPNHLGVLLAAPILLALGWLRGYWRVLAVALLGVGLVLTLSRSGMVALAAGLIVMALPMRARLLRAQVLVPVFVLGAATLVAVLVLVQLDPALARSLFFARFDTGANSAQVHLRLYGLVPDLLAQRPLFGNGLNAFALLFQDVAGGREGFGPHSAFIQALVETGIVGFSLFLGMVGWLLVGLSRVRDVRATALAAAIVGTLAGNVFYLTTQMMYVDVLYGMAAAAPVAMGILYNRRTMPTRVDSPPDSPRPTGAESGGGDDSVVGSPLADDDRRNQGRGNGSGPGGVRGAMQYWWIVALAVIVAVGFTLARHGSTGDVFRASATVYVGQPVSPNGLVLGTVGSKAATVLEIGAGDKAIATAARAAGTTSAAVRRGLTVTQLQTPLASKLAVAPTLMKVTSEMPRRSQAQAVTDAVATYIVDATNPYAEQKQRSLQAQVATAQKTVEALESQRSTAVSALAKASGTDRLIWSVLVSQLGGQLETKQSELASAQAQLSVSGEIEKSRVVSAPNASKVQRPSIGPAVLMAIFLGLVAGTALALTISTLRRR